MGLPLAVAMLPQALGPWPPSPNAQSPRGTACAGRLGKPAGGPLQLACNCPNFAASGSVEMFAVLAGTCAAGGEREQELSSYCPAASAREAFLPACRCTGG